MIKFSVIIPVYNVANYVEHCISSLVNQTYKNIEIIIVNDGSTDDSGEIIQRFAQRDSRIKVISQSNSGLSVARNTGLTNATGDYIAFVDGDDWIDERMFEILEINLKSNSVDFICFRLEFDNIIRQSQYIYGHPYTIKTLCGQDSILTDTLLVKNIPTSVCSKVYKANFLFENKLIFKSGIVNEDTLFSIQVSSCAQKVYFINDVLYHTIERENSISRSSYERLFRDMHKAFIYAKEYLDSKGMFTNISLLYKARYIKSMLYNLLQAAQRLPYMEYTRITEICFKETLYLKYNIKQVRKALPIRYRIALFISRWRLILYITMKAMNLIAIRMH